jgi:hypothetical protein
MTVDGYGKVIGEQVEDEEFAGIGDEQIRCSKCDKLLAELATRPWRIKCVRCKSVNNSM